MAGRPPIFESVEEMQGKIDAYFAEAKAEGIPYTIQGLALALGFNSRQSLLNYEDKEEFLDTIKKAKLKIEENKLIGGLTGKYNATVMIFDFKNNHDHKDRQDLDHTTAGKPITDAPDLSKYTDDELLLLAELQRKGRAGEA